MKSSNPYTGELIKNHQILSSAELVVKLENAQKAFDDFRQTTFNDRNSWMKSLSRILIEEKEQLGKTITAEMGKVLSESIQEVEKCAAVCDYYADHAEQMLADEELTYKSEKSFISYDPLGCVLAVMPWNFPFWQVFRFAAPALMAANVGVLKHASNVSQCAIEIERIIKKAGFPKDVFQALIINSDQVESVIDNSIIKAVTLTGSELAGSKVAEAAGRNIKKTVLELGGSDPFLILEDADLEIAVDYAIKSRFQNCGQSCIAAKRFIIPHKIRTKFLGLLMQKVEELKVGDPMSDHTNIGPMARLDLLEELDKQVDESIAQGAVVVTGGAVLDPDKCLYTPTILADVKKGMPAYDEELFGPVAAVITYNSLEEGIEIANDTKYGLGASVWTSDLNKGEEVARKIESGAVYVNELMKSDPALPFGGIKQSGYGRELSHLGIREFVNQKTIVVKKL